ncbi:transcription factor HIVEP3-like [Pitangus sulphuratus]|nr:transcription factor HIVEP3-like [Pitangus sulphuratus]
MGWEANEKLLSISVFRLALGRIIGHGKMPVAGTSEDLFQDSEGREGSEPVEEHQFSDLEESDDDDDNEDEEDEEEEESQDEPPLKLPEGTHTTLLLHSSGGSPSSQEEGTETASSLAQETVSSTQKAGEGQQASSSGLETKWSADSSDIAVCHSFLSLHRPALTSTEQLAPAERESVTRPQMSLAMDLSTSKDTSPRRRFFGKNIQLYESKLKIEPWSPPRSPGPTQPVCSRPLQAPHDIHGPGRGEENVFSHLPLHSQQLTRTPYPMIPIGGIQMVQARPSSHPSLVPGSVVSLQAGCFTPGSGDVAEFGRAPRGDEEPQIPAASVSPAAKVSKYTLSPEPSGGYLEEKMRTNELQQQTEQEEHRVKALAEPSPEEQAGPASPSTPHEHCPKPPTSGEEEPPKQMGKKQSGSSSTSVESPCTFISDAPPCDDDCPPEPPPSHPLSLRTGSLSGQPGRPGGTSSQSSPHPEHADLGQTQKKVDENAGST